MSRCYSTCVLLVSKVVLFRISQHATINHGVVMGKDIPKRNRYEDLAQSLGDNAFTKLIRDNPIRMFYHYTDIHGLKGILKNNTIWATHVSNLNDPHEVEHGIDFVLNYLRKSIGVPGSEGDFLSTCFGNFGVLSKSPDILESRYGAAFSKRGDDLSQFRAYSNVGAGYCIGFDAVSFQQNIRSIPYANGSLFQLFPIVYDARLKETLIDEALETGQEFIQRTIRELPGSDTEVLTQRTAAAVSGYLLWQSAQFKQEGFKDEEEWRLMPRIIPPQAIPVVNYLRYREKAGLFVPYLEIPFWLNQTTTNPLNEITVGPKLSYKKAQNGLLKFLHIEKIESEFTLIEIKRSTTFLQ